MVNTVNIEMAQGKQLDRAKTSLSSLLPHSLGLCIGPADLLSSRRLLKVFSPYFEEKNLRLNPLSI